MVQNPVGVFDFVFSVCFSYEGKMHWSMCARRKLGLLITGEAEGRVPSTLIAVLECNKSRG